jgi:WD40 repeat protein
LSEKAASQGYESGEGTVKSFRGHAGTSPGGRGWSGGSEGKGYERVSKGLPPQPLPSKETPARSLKGLSKLLAPFRSLKATDTSEPAVLANIHVETPAEVQSSSTHPQAFREELVIKGHTNTVCSVAFSADGEHILSASWDSTIRVWDLRTGALILGPLVGHTDSVYVALFSPNGKCIVSGSADKTIRFWDAYQGHVHLEPLRGHTDRVRSITFMPDGNIIASGSRDRTIRIWDARTGRAICTLTDTGHINTVAFSPDGRHLISGSTDPTMRIWDTQTWQPVRRIEEFATSGVGHVVYQPILGQVCSIGCRSKDFFLWDMNLPSRVVKFINGHTDCVNAVAFSSDGTWLVSVSDDRTLRIWDAATGKPISEPLAGHTESVWAVTVSPDGMCVVSGSWDDTIRVYTHY